MTTTKSKLLNVALTTLALVLVSACGKGGCNLDEGVYASDQSGSNLMVIGTNGQIVMLNNGSPEPLTRSGCTLTEGASNLGNNTAAFSNTGMPQLQVTNVSDSGFSLAETISGYTGQSNTAGASIALTRLASTTSNPSTLPSNIQQIVEEALQMASQYIGTTGINNGTNPYYQQTGYNPYYH